MYDDDDVNDDTPPAVIASIAAGVGPLPFLGVYSVIFIAHGVFYPVQPPDITRTRGGEAVAGLLAAAALLVLILTIWWFLNGRRRWPFVLGQLVVLATTLSFVADANTGSPAVPLGLIVTSAVALVFAFVPSAWAYMGVRPPSLPRRSKRPAQGSGPADPPTGSSTVVHT